MNDRQLKKKLKSVWRKGAKLEGKIKSMARRCGQRPGSRQWIESHKAYLNDMTRVQLEEMLAYILGEKKKAVRKYRKLVEM